LNISRTQSIQETNKNIEIYEGEQIVVKYAQDYEIDLSNEQPYAKLTMTEEYLLLDGEYDVFDEYVLKDGYLNVKRVYAGKEIINQSRPSSIEIFWKVIDENNIVNQYGISKNNFSNTTINRKSNSLSAKVENSRIKEFFESDINENRDNIFLDIKLDDKLRLEHISLEYDIEIDNIISHAIIKIKSRQTSIGQSPISTPAVALIIVDSILFIFTIILVAIIVIKQQSKVKTIKI